MADAEKSSTVHSCFNGERKAMYWHFFQEYHKFGRKYCNVPIEGGCTAGPNNEPKSFSVKTSGDNLLAHLEDEHDFDEGKMVEVLRKRGGTLHSYMKPTLKPAEEATVRFIAGTDQAPSMLDTDELADWIDALRKAPSFTPSRRVFRRALNRMVKCQEDRVKEVLQKSLAVSLSFDIWTKFANSYLAVNAHCITDKGQPDHFLLGLVEFKERHTGSHIASMMLSLVERFMPADAAVGVTSDSASNNTSKSFVKETNWMIKVLCAAHKASNASKAIFRDHAAVKRLLDRSKRFVKLSRRSPLTWSIPSSHQRKRAPFVSKRLPSIGETRFNGGYILLAAVNEHQEAIKLTQDQLKKDTKNKATWALIKDSVIQDQDVNVLEDLVPVLEALNDFIIAMQDRQLLLSDLLRQVWILRDVLEDLGNATDYAVTLRTAIDKYFDGIFTLTSVYVLCAALDPRFKVLSFLLPELISKTQSRSVSHPLETEGSGKDVREDVWGHIKNEALIVYEAFFESKEPSKKPKAKQSAPVTTSSSSKTLSNVRQASAAAFQGTTASAVEGNSSFQAVKVGLALVEDELRRYRELPQIGEDEDPFAWWQTHNTDLPILRKLAARFFSLQATEVENERDFSHTGNILTKARNRTTPRTLQKLIVVKMNDSKLRENRVRRAERRRIPNRKQAAVQAAKDMIQIDTVEIQDPRANLVANLEAGLNALDAAMQGEIEYDSEPEGEEPAELSDDDDEINENEACPVPEQSKVPSPGHALSQGTRKRKAYRNPYYVYGDDDDYDESDDDSLGQRRKMSQSC